MINLVSAVMVTRNDESRQYLTREAVISFLNQSYPSKELIVVMDHDSPEFIMNDRSFKVVRGKPEDRLGDLRNLGIEQAQGEFIIQWDDDDWRRPDAIDLQSNALVQNDLEACCLCNQIRYSFANNCAYVAYCHVGHAGTIMHRRSVVQERGIKYPHQKKSEDAEFWKAFWRNKKSSAIQNDPAVYVRFHHGSNTWHAGHIMGRLANEQDVYRLSPEQTLFLRSVLTRYQDQQD